MITQDRLKELFHYNPETGWFTNRVLRGHAKVGERAGTYHIYGYRQIQIGGRIYKEHRLAWLFVYGFMPEYLDHKDGQRDNNAILNLREATKSENGFNADREPGESGLRGAYLDRRDQKWFSRIKTGHETIWLGKFDTPEQASEAFRESAELHHGEFAFHNRPSEKECA